MEIVGAWFNHTSRYLNARPWNEQVYFYNPGAHMKELERTDALIEL